MEALLYAGAALGAVLALAGVVILARRVRGHKAEIEIAGFGKIKTTHHGMALVFVGAALIGQSVTALQQRDDLRRTVEQLKRSEELLVSFVTPALLGDTAFRNYFVVATPGQREAIVRRAMGLLYPEFHRVTDVKQSRFEEKDFAAVRAIYDFLLEDDPRNGSALYYKGEAYRLLGRPFIMRESFFYYLDQAPAPGGRLPGVKGLQYFDERTAWIHHLLANQFLCEALQGAPAKPDLKLVAAQVEGVRKYKRDGFIAGETTWSTDAMERAVKEGVIGMKLPRCPAAGGGRSGSGT